MAGETDKATAICIDIHGYSRTSHVVKWITPKGKLFTSVKGAMRPKSNFLGQYDLNYTCDIVYYLNARNDLHALRECRPVNTRDPLRNDYRALCAASYMRSVVLAMCSNDASETRNWFGLLDSTLDSISAPGDLAAKIVRFDLAALELAGIRPDFSGYDKNAEWSAFSLEYGRFNAAGRSLRISRDVARYLAEGAADEKKYHFSLEAARVIGVYYTFHTDQSLASRRVMLDVISKKKETGEQ